MEAIFSQQEQSNAEAVTKTHGDNSAATAASVAQIVETSVGVAASVAETVSDTSKSNEDKAAQITQTAAAVVEAIPGVAAFAPVIAVGVDLEPEIYHGISALIHFFQNRKKAQKTAPAK